MSDALDPFWSRVRDGEPVALAALCNRWGRPVFAYCEHVASPGQGVVVASRALGQFRAAGAGLSGAGPRDAEAQLRRITRRAALACDAAPSAATDGDYEQARCPGRRAELVALVEDALSPAARRMLDEHVSECAACRALLRRLEAGERAFERPPRVPLPPGVLDEIVLALVFAAPLRPDAAEPNAVRSAVLRLFALAAGAPTHNGAAAGTPVTHEPGRPPVDVKPRAGPQLERSKIARTRQRRGPDRKPRQSRAERRRRAAGERSRRSSLLMTAVVVAASSGGIVIIDSWSAGDSQPQHVSGDQATAGHPGRQQDVTRREAPAPPLRASALR